MTISAVTTSSSRSFSSHLVRSQVIRKACAITVIAAGIFLAAVTLGAPLAPLLTGHALFYVKPLVIAVGEIGAGLMISLGGLSGLGLIFVGVKCFSRRIFTLHPFPSRLLPTPAQTKKLSTGEEMSGVMFSTVVKPTSFENRTQTTIEYREATVGVLLSSAS